MSDEYIVEYSIEPGLLLLSTGIRKRLNITVHLAVLDPVDNDCFGGYISKWIFEDILGYDDVLKHSVRELTKERKGYLRNTITNEITKFPNMLDQSHNYIIAACFMLGFTLGISMLLRYCHNQIFLLIVNILRMLELNVSFEAPIAEILTVFLALIGIESVMTEYFNDTIISFYIILLVWFSDQYNTICCHAAVTKRYWPRFFYFYMYGFYVYHCRFDGQYGWLALLTATAFIMHAMVYFYNHLELAAILQRVPLTEQGHLLPSLSGIAMRNLQARGQNNQQQTPPQAATNQPIPDVNNAEVAPTVVPDPMANVLRGRILNILMAGRVTFGRIQIERYFQIRIQNLMDAVRNGGYRPVIPPENNEIESVNLSRNEESNLLADTINTEVNQRETSESASELDTTRLRNPCRDSEVNSSTNVQTCLNSGDTEFGADLIGVSASGENVASVNVDSLANLSKIHIKEDLDHSSSSVPKVSNNFETSASSKSKLDLLQANATQEADQG